MIKYSDRKIKLSLKSTKIAIVNDDQGFLLAIESMADIYNSNRYSGKVDIKTFTKLDDLLEHGKSFDCIILDADHDGDKAFNKMLNQDGYNTMYFFCSSGLPGIYDLSTFIDKNNISINEILEKCEKFKHCRSSNILKMGMNSISVNQRSVGRR